MYCDKKTGKNSILLSCIFANVILIFFMGMFKSAKLPGNLFNNQIIFGALLGVGNVSGGILSSFDDSKMF
jgi:hypothetical protein